MNNCYLTISHIALLNFTSVVWPWLCEMTNVLDMVVLSREISRFHFWGLSRSRTNQRRANKLHAMNRTPTVPIGGYTLRLLPMFLLPLTVSFGRWLLPLDVASSGRSLPPRRLVVLNWIVFLPCTGHGMADAEVHDDMDGGMGECEGLHQVKTAVELLHYIYIGVHQQFVKPCLQLETIHYMHLSPWFGWNWR